MLDKIKLGKPKAEQLGETNEPTEQAQQIDQPQPTMTEQAAASEAQSPVSSQTTDNSTDFFNEYIEESEQQAIQTQAETVRAELLNEDDFHKVFVTAFQVSSHLSGLKSLYVDEGEGSAKAATKAIYDTCLEVPALRFMLQPSNKWLERGFAVAAFTVPMAHGVSKELAERRKPKKQSSGNFSAAKQAAGKPKADGEPDADQAAALTGGA